MFCYFFWGKFERNNFDYVDNELYGIFNVIKGIEKLCFYCLILYIDMI